MKQVFAHICMWVRLTGCIAVCKLLVLDMGRGSAVEAIFVIGSSDVLVLPSLILRPPLPPVFDYLQ